MAQKQEVTELDFGVTVRGLAVGERLFGRYMLRSILGRGGMGVVWRAFDENLERDVALKFLPELMLHDSAVLDDLKGETKRSLELTHHHIVRIYNFAQDAKSACISMEYVDGLNLSALRLERQNKVFEVENLLPLLEQVCAALEYAHTRAKIVHCDLKPANLMLNSKGDIKIADFGIARSLTCSISMLTVRRGISGTLVYMSPQQLDGDRSSHLDDIYSLGATIYELLTGKPPFYSGNIDRQIHEKPPRPLAERRNELQINGAPVPLHWEATIASCLAKDPAQRPQSARELANRLSGRETSLVTSPRSRVAVAPKLTIAIVAAALLIAGLSTMILKLRESSGAFYVQPVAVKPATAIQQFGLARPVVENSTPPIARTNQQRARDVADRIVALLEAGDMSGLAALVHPLKGVRFSPTASVDSTQLTFQRQQVVAFDSDTRKYDWQDYDDTPLTPIEYIKQRAFSKDYSKADVVNVDKNTRGPGSDKDNAAGFYPGATIVEYYFRGRGEDSLGWSALRLVLERNEGSWYLVGVITATWNP